MKGINLINKSVNNVNVIIQNLEKGIKFCEKGMLKNKTKIINIVQKKQINIDKITEKSNRKIIDIEQSNNKFNNCIILANNFIKKLKQ